MTIPTRDSQPARTLNRTIQALNNRLTRHLALAVLPLLWLIASTPVQGATFTSSFLFDTCKGFASQGSNPYFILVPGYQQVLAGTEDGEHVVLQITVLPQTIQIAGVAARIVEEREFHGGRLVELSLNYFVICNRNNSVIYLGEDVNIYNDNGSVTHEGSWRTGVAGARPGIIIPGIALIGARYFQEIAPGVALDQAEILAVTSAITTPAGRFTNCVKTRETTPLEPGHEELKFYAPGVGIVVDGVLKLVSTSGLN